VFKMVNWYDSMIDTVKDRLEMIENLCPNNPYVSRLIEDIDIILDSAGTQIPESVNLEHFFRENK